MRIIAGVLLSILSLLCTPVYGTGKVARQVISDLQNGEIVFEGGARILIDPSTVVTGRGLTLTIADLRPGWALGKIKGEEESPALEVQVTGIPAVREFPAYIGARDRVRVLAPETGLLPLVEALDGVDLGAAMKALTIGALLASGRFRVLEGDQESDDPAANDPGIEKTSTRTLAQVGKLLPSGFEVHIKLLEFEFSRNRGAASGVFGISASKNTAFSRLAMRLTLVDTSTGATQAQVEAQREFRASTVQVRADLAETVGTVAVAAPGPRRNDFSRISASGIALSVDGFVQSPLGALLSLVINDLIERLLAARPVDPWKGVIVRRLGVDRIVVRGGANEGLTVGALLEVIHVGADNPGGQRPSLEVTEVHEKFSIARPLGGVDPQEGASCVLAQHGDRAHRM